MKTRALKLVLLVVLIASPSAFGQAGDSTKVAFGAFQDPPKEFRGTRWFTFQMPSMTEENIKTQIDAAAENPGYGSWMATPDAGRGGAGRGARRGAGPATGPAPAPVAPPPPASTALYLNEEFFRVYKIGIEEGLKRGLPLTFMYDEQQFPSGFAGGLLKAKYPDMLGHGLEKVEKDATGPAQVQVAAPINNGIYIGAVRMNLDTLECVDISDMRSGNTDAVDCSVPAGDWKVMLFYLDGNANGRGLVDYLNPDAVDKLIEVMHQQYYDHLKEYFGKVIKYTFFDEPAMHHPEFKGRLWTPVFNREFQKKFGYSPMKYYPALWYDIGPDTAAARNALFGFRAEMYSTNYIGRLAAWAEAHGVKSGGHLDQEEAPNPVPVQGDLMKVFKYQQVPGHDDIWWSGRSTMSYKIMTSAASNWDKPIAMAETYAAYRQQSEPIAYRTAMDQHTFGVSLQVGNYPRGTDAPTFGAYLGRLQYLLQHGKHVADVAVLYPIAAMQADYRFATPVRVGTRQANADFYYALEGGILPPEADYMQLGEMLFRGYHLDYTFLHPEVIQERCKIEGNKLILDNKENREEYSVLFMPGQSTINLAVAKKIQDFYNAGGTVIATSRLPSHSAEFGHDKDVVKIMDEVFGFPKRGPMTAELRSNTDEFKIWLGHPNQAGGKAFFIPRLDTTMMNDVLTQGLPVRDVDFYDPKQTDINGNWQRVTPTWPLKSGTAYDGAFTYIHKNKDGHDIYFFANSFDAPIDTQVVLRGKQPVVIWNPHTGEKSTPEFKFSEMNGQPITTVHLQLDAVKSTFFVTE